MKRYASPNKRFDNVLKKSPHIKKQPVKTLNKSLSRIINLPENQVA